jgi:hypothetical protein
VKSTAKYLNIFHNILEVSQQSWRLTTIILDTRKIYWRSTKNILKIWLNSLEIYFPFWEGPMWNLREPRFWISPQYLKYHHNISNITTISQIFQQYLKYFNNMLNISTISWISHNILNISTISWIFQQYFEYFNNILNISTISQILHTNSLGIL